MPVCEKPYMLGVMPCGCGDCDPCRLRRRSLWSHRILLESLAHEHSSFVTLTYDEAHRPVDGSVSPRDAQLWLKRLRKCVPDRRVRYFLAGEYGDQSWRPHYHVALFGVSPLEDRLVRDSWGLGHVLVGELTPKSASYISGYVTKKMMKKEDSRLCGRNPEFQRMSLRPGVGATFMEKVGEVVKSSGLHPLLSDVPSVLRHGKSLKPIGRYLQRKLREKVGRSAETPGEVMAEYGEKLRTVFKEALKDEEKTRHAESWSSLWAQLNQQRIWDAKSKVKLISGGKSL